MELKVEVNDFCVALMSARDGSLIAEIHTGKDDAERIAAAVNVCVGISTSVLKSGDAKKGSFFDSLAVKQLRKDIEALKRERDEAISERDVALLICNNMRKEAIDNIAGLALQGLLANSAYPRHEGEFSASDLAEISRIAYDQAKAMLNEKMRRQKA